MLIKFVGPLGSKQPIPVKCRKCGKNLPNKGSRPSIEVCNKCRRKR